MRIRNPADGRQTHRPGKRKSYSPDCCSIVEHDRQIEKVPKMLGLDMSDVSPLAELGAFAVLVGLVWWLVTKGMPAMLERFANESAQQRAEFGELLENQRAEFREDLSAQREQSGQLARSGQASVDQLTEAVGELKDELKLDREQRERT